MVKECVGKYCPKFIGGFHSLFANAKDVYLRWG